MIYDTASTCEKVRLTYTVLHRPSSAFKGITGFALGGLRDAGRFARNHKGQPATRAKLHNASGLQRLKDEHRFLLTRERRRGEVVAWLPAMAIAVKTRLSYGKRRLRRSMGGFTFSRSESKRGSVDPEARGGRGRRGHSSGDRAYANARERSEW